MNPKWPNSWLKKKNGQLKLTLSTRKVSFLVTLYFLMHFLHFSHKIFPLNLLLLCVLLFVSMTYLSPYAIFKIFLEAFLAGFHTDAQVGSFKIPNMSIPPYTVYKVRKNCIPKALLTKYMFITIVQVYLRWICNSTFCTIFF